MWPFSKKKETRHADAIIIGAQRSGTTSLFKYLSEHAQVLPAARKEVHYFDNHYHHGPKWYAEFFPEPEEGKVRVEASPYYVFHPHVADRIAKDLPNARLILILRDPVERAYSHFRLMKHLNREPLEFLDALKAEDSRVAPETKKMLSDKKYKSQVHQDLSYAARGHYDDQIAHWQERVDPERLLILKTNELSEDPGTALRKVTDHIGIDPFPNRDFPVHNHISGQDMDPEARAYLNKVFENSKWLNKSIVQ